MDNQEYGPPPSYNPQGAPAQGYGGFTPPAGHVGPPPPSMPPPSMPPSGISPAGMPPPNYPPVMLTGPGAASSRKNWMGVTSLILGLVGGGVLGAIFGGLGISAANRGEATNKKMATWGLVLNIAVPVLFFGGMVVIGGIASVFGADRVSFNDLAVGDCVGKPAGWNDVGEELDSDFVDKLSCDEPHWGQVYETATLSGSTYPGDDDLVVRAEAMCISETGLSRLKDPYYEEAYLNYVSPTAQSWHAGDRSVVCFASTATYDAEESFLANG